MISPDFLKPGDKIGIVAPAGNINYPYDILEGVKTLADWGLFIIEGQTPSLRQCQFAGTDEQRIDDLQYMLNHPELKAIIAVRGGYGSSRIIDKIDFSGFARHPKWLIGFSDLTLFLSHLETLGYKSIHGPMVKHLGQEDSRIATQSLKQILFGDLPEYKVPGHFYNRTGMASGSLVGGNLCLLAHTIGSGSEADTRGKILFIEDVGEQLYNLDRMLWQLHRAGKLDQLAGLIAGQFTETKGTPETFGQDVYEIIFSHVKDFSYPVAFDFPIGHISENMPVVVGAHANLIVEKDNTTLNFTSRE